MAKSRRSKSRRSKSHHCKSKIRQPPPTNRSAASTPGLCPGKWSAFIAAWYADREWARERSVSCALSAVVSGRHVAMEDSIDGLTGEFLVGKRIRDTQPSAVEARRKLLLEFQGNPKKCIPIGGVEVVLISLDRDGRPQARRWLARWRISRLPSASQDLRKRFPSVQRWLLEHLDELRRKINERTQVRRPCMPTRALARMWRVLVDRWKWDGIGGRPTSEEAVECVLWWSRTCAPAWQVSTRRARALVLAEGNKLVAEGYAVTRRRRPPGTQVSLLG